MNVMRTTTTMKRTGSLSGSLVLSLLLALALAVGFPGLAGAAQEGSSGVDPDGVGSLEIMTIANDDAGRYAVTGVGFELAAVNGLDLSTQADMDRAAEIIASGVIPEDLTQATELEYTDANGRTFAGPLGVGLYVLTHVEGTGDESQAYRPMMFTLPSADQTGEGSWVYDLRIYPKPVPADCDCIDEPVDPVPVEPVPGEPDPPAQPTLPVEPPVQPVPEQPADPAPRPGIPTGEVLAENMSMIWVVLALVAAAGAATVALRKPRQDAS